MGDPLSVTASLIAVLQAAATAIQYVKDVKTGSSDRTRLRDELRSTVLVLEMLKDRLEDSAAAADATGGQTLLMRSAVMESVAAPHGPLLLFKQLVEDIVAKLAPQDRLRRLAQPFRWPFDKKDVNEMLAVLERLKLNFNLIIQNDLLGLAQITSLKLDEVSGQVDNLAEARKDDEKDKILAWMSSLSFNSKQAEALEGVQPGTGRWFLTDDKFVRWVDSTEESTAVLWCPGIPGAGKTTITSLVIDRLDKRLVGHDEEAFAFIYCDYNHRATQTPLVLLRSILGQVLRRMAIDGLPPEVLSVYNLHKKYETQPPLTQIVDLLRQILEGFKKVHIVVDALDECAESEEAALNFVSNILNLGKSVRLLCTSRFSTTLDTFFKQATRMEISARAEDVRMFIETQIPRQSRLSKHVRADPKLKDDIIEAIVDQSQGMFLLATLYFESLSRKLNRKEVRASLRTLPKTLDATYDQAFAKIRSQADEDVELAETILFWILCARRPLRVLELQQMYAVKSLTQGDPLEDDDLPDGEILTSVCSGLVTVDRDFEYVRIVHYTAQQYFQRVYQDKVQETRFDITRLSLTYLTLPNFAGGASSSDIDLIARLSSFPFLKYATLHWGSEGADVNFEELWTQLNDFVSSKDAISTASQIWSVPQYEYMHWSQDVPRGVPPLVMVACFELPKVVRRLVAGGHSIEGKGSDGETPLIRAASLGHAGNVSALLELGAEVDAMDTDGETALHRAASKGRAAVVERLLKGGANVNAKAAASWTVLMSAVSSGDIEVVRFIVDAAADLAAQTDWGDSALSLAMRNGQEAISTFLADNGAIMPDSISGRRASVVAARKGLKQLVRRLTAAYDAVAREGLQRQDPARGGELAFVAELPEEQELSSTHASSSAVPSGEYTHLSEALDGINYSRGFSRKYTLLDKLGKGHFAEVFLCIRRVSGVKYAVKRFKIDGARDMNNLKGIKQEVTSLQTLRHANIVVLVDVIVQDAMNELFLVEEFAAGGELFNYIVLKTKLSEAESRRLFSQLFSALLFIHQQGWIHRDVKPENILLMDDNLTIKLADFGLAKYLESDGHEPSTVTLAGTPSYVAPEILTDSKSRRYSYAIDVWSAGVVLYICLCGFPPFSDELYTTEFPFTLTQQILRGRFDYPSPYWDNVGDPALDLIDLMLTVAVEKRYTAAQCLQHPWMC